MLLEGCDSEFITPWKKRFEAERVEIWFSKIQRDIIARGIFTSVDDLHRKIMRYSRAYNQTTPPIKWSYKDASNCIKPTSEINDTQN